MSPESSLDVIRRTERHRGLDRGGGVVAAQVGHQEAAAGGHADHGEEGGGGVAGPHPRHHRRRVRGVPHHVEPGAGEGHARVAAPGAARYLVPQFSVSQ